MRRYLLVACFLSALSFATRAHADDAAMAEAQARFKEGLELADNAKYEEARLKFLQAVAVLKAPAVLFNLASTEQKTGHDVEAIEHYRAFLTTGASDTRITDAMRDKARANIAELLKNVGQIAIEAPAGAKISVDGKPLDAAPNEPIPVTAGKHTVDAAHAGKVKSLTVDAKVGAVEKARFDFTPDAAGTYQPPVGGQGSRWSTARIVTVGALAAGAVTGAALAVVFRFSALDNVDQAKGLLQGTGCVGVDSPTCTKVKQLEKDRDTNVTVSTVSFVAAAAFTAGAVAAVYFWPTSKERAARLVPAAAPGYGGLSFVGRF